MGLNEYEWSIQPQDYGVLSAYVFMETVTDIDFNGKDIWISSLSRGRYCAQEQLSTFFVEQFCSRVANMVSKPFNKNNPVIAAETRNLRITIVHASVAETGTTICIRKTPNKMRLNEKLILRSQYSTEEIMNLLGNCVCAGLSIAVCGGMGTGKTELIKYLTHFIPANEKAITMEDTMEVHFRDINPQKDCIALKVNERLFSYEDALKTSLRLNAEWMILSEVRSKEVKYLLENMSIGTGCLTTLHADDVRNIPDRIKNMYADSAGLDQVENDVYTFLNVGVMLRRKQQEDKTVVRYIDQVCFFTRKECKNTVTMMVDERKLLHMQVPEHIKKRMRHKDIMDPFKAPKGV
ncbi:CpaF/VirB11 family protein [Lachnospiraceae bacterium ZAX-1]